MYVKTKVLPSNIHGLGLFADQFIPKGTTLWKFTPGLDLKFTKAQIQSFPELAQQHLKTYGWLSKKSQMYCYAIDNGKYFNHSKTPNSLSAYYDDEEELVTKAIRDIEIGEEITDDYKTY